MATPLLNSYVLGRYADAVLAGKVFTACNPAIKALSLNSTTATGLILSNPLTSGVNMILIQASVALASAAAGQTNLAWTGNLLTTAEGLTTHTTPLIVKNCFISSANTTVCKADEAATIPTPAFIRSVGGGPVAASSITPPQIIDPIDGLIILAPGCVISLQALTTAVSVVASAVWIEQPA